mmetsp:Transcript_825/g.1249  ORF Transcript_825/g.1249 Transcript_825/m.1249 type:complete len:83 (-) Transcript_825:96-344(-)
MYSSCVSKRSTSIFASTKATSRVNFSFFRSSLSRLERQHFLILLRTRYVYHLLVLQERPHSLRFHRCKNKSAHLVRTELDFQ